MQGLPAARQAWKPVDGVFLSNRGLILPSIPLESANLWVLLLAAIGLGISWFIHKRLVAQQMIDGKPRPSWPYTVALVLVLPGMLSLILHAQWSIELPELRGFNFVGGLTLAPEYFALLIALVTYTSAFIAEIVRSGIQSVPRGQWDAANALGLRRSFMLRQIILPQALRVIVPPMTSQYLNLTKNSSLAVAIGYPDLVSVFAGTVLNQTNQAVEVILITMGVYLAISLLTALAMNWFNARMALVER
jgi:general L-amino acid transport system permease protein